MEWQKDPSDFRTCYREAKVFCTSDESDSEPEKDCWVPSDTESLNNAIPGKSEGEAPLVVAEQANGPLPANCAEAKLEVGTEEKAVGPEVIQNEAEDSETEEDEPVDETGGMAALLEFIDAPMEIDNLVLGSRKEPEARPELPKPPAIGTWDYSLKETHEEMRGFSVPWTNVAFAAKLGCVLEGSGTCRHNNLEPAGCDCSVGSTFGRCLDCGTVFCTENCCKSAKGQDISKIQDAAGSSWGTKNNPFIFETSEGNKGHQAKQHWADNHHSREEKGRDYTNQGSSKAYRKFIPAVIERKFKEQELLIPIFISPEVIGLPAPAAEVEKRPHRKIVDQIADFPNGTTPSPQPKVPNFKRLQPEMTPCGLYNRPPPPTIYTESGKIEERDPKIIPMQQNGGLLTPPPTPPEPKEPKKIKKGRIVLSDEEKRRLQVTAFINGQGRVKPPSDFL